ncbi:serine--tRNA ligase [Candidatus Micrarchaeota archaeon]|nr:serine--tRNA ligase [Candidatus Micrarchaeota archaeon]
MLDIKAIRANPEELRAALKNRQQDALLVAKLLELDEVWRRDKKELDELRAERNTLGLAISSAKKKKENADEPIKRSSEVSSRIKVLDEEVERLERDLENMMLLVPNIPDKSVPVGADENSNKEVIKFGKPEKFSKDVLPHDELGQKLGLIDFERGTKLGGHRFTVMYGAIAKLERAIAAFMLNVHTTNGYTECWVPHLVKSEMMQGTGNLPKFAEDLYSCKDDDLWLIPTAEVPLTNLHSGEILEVKDLPKFYTAFTPCYRREAGAYGKDIKGMIRQHQFDKVELVKIVSQESSFNELEGMVKDAQGILKLLGLPYRVVTLCTGDMGFASAKTYDIEVWIPSQDKYREISSCSNCTNFQARRANIRYRDVDGEIRFAHTLNGSGLAVGRTLIAILENYQDAEGVAIPEPLQDYMGMERIDFK